MTPCQLESLKLEYKGLGIVYFEVPSPEEGAIDSEGFSSKVVLYPTKFSSSLRLPFYRPIRDVLDFIGVAPT